MHVVGHCRAPMFISADLASLTVPKRCLRLQTFCMLLPAKKCTPAAGHSYHGHGYHGRVQARLRAPCRILRHRFHGKTSLTSRQRSVDPGTACRCWLSPDALFTVVTIAVIPIYTMMVGFPQLQQTKSLMQSRLAMAAVSLLYTAALVNWALAGSLTDLSLTLQHTFTKQRVAWFAGLAKNLEVTCLAWIHLLFLDLLQARYVYMDGLRHQIPVRHSIVLCFMFGPVGLLSHMVTRKVVDQLSQRSIPSASQTG